MSLLTHDLRTFCASFLIVLATGWSDESKAHSSATLSHHLDQIIFLDPPAVYSIKDQYREFIEFSDRKREEEQLTVGDELMEIGKIVGMGVVAAVLYGVVHDLITTQINFDYFSDLYLTPHGVFTRDYYPFVYESESRILYALLWGTIATWWVGLPIGMVSALFGRLGSAALKMTWHDFVYPAAALMGINLSLALLDGVLTYFASGDSFTTVLAMHQSSYKLACYSVIWLALFSYVFRNTDTSAVQQQCIGFTEDIFGLFNKYPENTDLQALVQLHLNSRYGNCSNEIHYSVSVGN